MRGQRVTLLKEALIGNSAARKSDKDIQILELCSPPANLTDHLFFEEMAEIITILDTTKDCKGLIVRGQGRHFSSGADIEELIDRLGHDDQGTMLELNSRSLSIFTRLSQLPFPVVAVIQGCCLGSGLELALACHYRIAAKNALFSMPETGYGLMPGCGGTRRLPELVGVGKSIEMILSGENYLAEDAQQMRLVDITVERKDLLDTAIEIIQRFGVRS